MRILFVSDSFPYPPDSGTKVRDYNLIRRLSQYCELSLLAFVFSEREEAGAAVMQQYCQPVETVRFRRQSKRKHLPGVIRCLLRGQPLESKFVFSPEFAAKLRHLTNTCHYDVVQIDCTPMAPYQTFIEGKNGHAGRRTRTSLVFIDVNADKFRRRFLYERPLNMRIRNLIDWLLMSRWEAAYAACFDMCVMMSELDAQRLRQRNPRLNPVVIPNGVDVDEKRPLSEMPGSADILLVGTLTHTPWADAVRYFYSQIFPRICQEVPQARMVVVGDAPPEIQTLACDRVVITGWVEDVEPYYQQSALLAVPLRAAGGTRHKILESLAYGRPVVSTTVGCEGLDLLPDGDLLVADDPVRFAYETVRLLTEPVLRHRLREHGRRSVEERYSWDTIARKLLTAYEHMCDYHETVWETK